MKNKVGTAIVTAAFGALGSTSAAIAADWDIIPYINVMETYTDDVDLDSDLPQSDFVTQATAGTRISTIGPRLNLSMDYGLTYLYYPGLDENKDDIRHNFIGTAQTEVIRELFFFDTSASVRQQFMDRRSSFSSVDVTRSANRGTLAVIDASPYMLNKVGGNFAVLETRYRYNYINLSRNISLTGEDLGGYSGNVHEVSMILTSGLKFTRLTWGFENSYRKSSSSVGRSNDVYSSILNGDYQINRTAAAIASFGYMKRNASSGPGQFSEFVWRVGGRLTPGPRTSLEVTYGKDFSGYSWDVAGSYLITPNITFDVSYNQLYQSFQDLAIQDFLDGGGNEADIPQEIISANFTKRQRWLATIVGVRGRSTIAFSASHTKSTAEDVTSSYTRKGVGVDWTHQLGTRLSIAASANLMEDDYFIDPEKDLFIAFNASVNYNISENIVGSIDYIHTKRRQLLFDYIPRRSNFISVSIGVTF